MASGAGRMLHAGVSRWLRRRKRVAGRFIEESANAVGQGPQKDPTKGTQNPFTKHLKLRKPQPAEVADE